MNHKIFRLSLFFLLTLSSLNALDLRGQINNYIQGHPLVQAAHAQTEAAMAGYRGTFSLLFPYNMRAELETVFSDGESELQGSISFHHTLFDAQRNEGLKKADRLSSAAAAYEEWMRQLVLYDLLSRALEIAGASEEYRLALRRQEQIREADASSIKRFELGSLKLPDLNFSHARLAAAEADTIKAQLRHESLIIGLEELMGNEFDVAIETLSTLGFRENPLGKDLPSRETLMGSRADFRQSLILIEAADHDIRGARRNTIPAIGLGAGAYDLLTEDPEFRISVDIELPLASAAKDRQDVKTFSMTRESALQNLNDALRIARGEIRQTRKAMELLDSAGKSYAKAADYSAKALSGVAREYELGYGSIYDLIDAQTDYYQMEMDLTRSHIDYRSAQLDFCFLTGSLELEELLFEE